MFSIIRFLRVCAIAALPLMTLSLPMTSPAAAKAVTFKGTGVAFPINLPDNWRVKNIDRGVEISSPDQEIYLWVEAVTTDSVERVIDEYFKYFKQQGVTTRQPIDQQKHTVGAVDLVQMDIPATYQGAETIVRFVITEARPNESKSLFIGYWASPTGDKTHDATLTGIIADILRP